MTPHSPASTERTNKDVVGTFHREVLGEGRLARLETLVAAGLPIAPAGISSVAGLPAGRRALAKRLQSTGGVPNEIKRIIADGDMVYAHVKYPGAPAFAGVDMYRVVENRIAEHWSVRQPKPQSSAAVEEWFRDDPSVELTPGLDREWIKRRVRETIEQLWMPGNAALVPAYYARSYVQHNPDMPGGYERIVAVVETSIRSYIERAAAHSRWRSTASAARATWSSSTSASSWPASTGTMVCGRPMSTSSASIARA
jgi:predicted SnoaL-like aldol condensation-catalyzing enzyme